MAARKKPTPEVSNTNNNTNHVNVNVSVKKPRSRSKSQKQAKPNWLVRALVIAFIGLVVYFIQMTLSGGSNEPEQSQNEPAPIEGHREI